MLGRSGKIFAIWFASVSEKIGSVSVQFGFRSCNKNFILEDLLFLAILIASVNLWPAAFQSEITSVSNIKLFFYEVNFHPSSMSASNYHWVIAITL